MLRYLEFLNSQINIPTSAIVVIVVIFIVLQGLGELLELKGKFAPEFMKVRKHFAKRKQQEAEFRQQLQEATIALKHNNELFDELNKHYSTDGIATREAWMREVDKQIEVYGILSKEMREKLDKTFDMILDVRIDGMRNAILNFATHISGDHAHTATNEQFRDIMRLHEEYEQIIESNGKTNGQVDVAYRIIEEEYERRLRDNMFLEAVRGYN